MVTLREIKKNYDVEILDKKDLYSVRYFVKSRLKKYGELPDSEAFNVFMERRANFKARKEISNALMAIKEWDTLENYRLICGKLMIDFNRVKGLSLRGYTIKEIIIYTWFYGDKINRKNEKVLSLKILRKVTDENFLLNSTSLIDFIVAYKLGNKDSVNKIVELSEPYFRKIIEKRFRKFKIQVTNASMEEILSECALFIYKVVDRIVLVENSRVCKYFYNCVKYHVIDYMEKNYCVFKEMPLSDVIETGESLGNIHQDPLMILIKQEENDALVRAFNSLSREEKTIVYELYFKESSIVSVWDVLIGDVDGEDICFTVGKFQKLFLNFYGEEEKV